MSLATIDAARDAANASTPDAPDREPTAPTRSASPSIAALLAIVIALACALALICPTVGLPGTAHADDETEGFGIETPLVVEPVIDEPASETDPTLESDVILDPNPDPDFKVEAETASMPTEGATGADGAEHEPSAESAPVTAPDPVAPAPVPSPVAVSFVYLDAPAIAVGSEQVVAVVMDGGLQMATASLAVVNDSDGSELTVPAARLGGDAALFGFVPDAGAWTVSGLLYTLPGDDTVYEVSFSHIGIACSFEVTDAQTAAAALAALAVDEGVLPAGAASDEPVSAFLTVDAAGNEVEVSSLADALLVAGAVPADAAPEEYRTLTIALDAGHGGIDSGALGYGLIESDLTWAITMYCKEELEQYAGVRVVLTRQYLEEGLDKYERTPRAVEQGADVLVSIHINAADFESVWGAEVWVPNDSSFNYDKVYLKGNELGQNILDRLAALGLYSRGLLTGVNDTYTNPDGSDADPWAITRTARLEGIIAVLVEHGFITNGHDAYLLSQDWFLKQLGVADATAIAQTFGLIKGGGWVTDENGRTQFLLKDQGPATDTVMYITDRWYGFDADGYLVEGGWQTVEGALRHFEADGMATSGWALVDGAWTHFDEKGLPLDDTAQPFEDTPFGEWYTDGGYIDYVARNGIMTGIKDDLGRTLYFAPAANLTRGQLATILFRLANPSSTATTDRDDYAASVHFSDVPSYEYYTAAVEWCLESGVVTGYTDGAGNPLGLFGPEDPVTREQLATMIARFARTCGADTAVDDLASLRAMPDGLDADDYALASLEWCARNGIITGSVDLATGTPYLLAYNRATRAETAKMITVLVRDVLDGAIDDADEHETRP